MQKKCPKCGVVKDRSGFSKNKARRDGLQTQCKECYAGYRLANRERILGQKREYRQANRERIQEYQQEYRQANRERYLERSQEYRQANRERYLEYFREYIEAYPERQGFGNFCKRIGKSTKEVAEDYNMTRKQIWDETREFYLESRRLTEETGEPHHVDHIQPVCEGGEHRAYNLQVLTGSENCSKGGHWTQADDDLTDEDIERLDQEAISFSQTLTLA